VHMPSHIYFRVRRRPHRHFRSREAARPHSRRGCARHRIGAAREGSAVLRPRTI
jgi:hypothetical protein